MIKIFTDGGARGNPGPGAIGVVVKAEDGHNLATISRIIGKTTNNIAEYTAVVTALEWLKNNPITQPTSKQIIYQFFIDSILVVNQLNGVFKVKDGNLRNLLLRVRVLEQEVGGQIYYNSISREKNTEADFLVNKAFDNV